MGLQVKETFFAKIDDSGFKLENKALFSKYAKRLPQGRYTITLQNYSPKRSVQANRYYWGCCVAMIRDRMIELGNEVTSENVHDYLKDRFNSKELFNKDGVNIGCIGDTTTRLTKTEFEEYLEKVKRFAAEMLDLYIPDPNTPSVLFAEYDNKVNATIISNG